MKNKRIQICVGLVAVLFFSMGAFAQGPGRGSRGGGGDSLQEPFRGVVADGKDLLRQHIEQQHEGEEHPH